MADWISVEEAASISGYSSEQIRRLIRSGEIRAQKKGPMWWVDRRSFDSYVKEAQQSEDKRKGPKASSQLPEST
jgi:excisionase family DNA binding protein